MCIGATTDAGNWAAEANKPNEKLSSSRIPTLTHTNINTEREKERGGSDTCAEPPPPYCERSTRGKKKRWGRGRRK